MTTKPTTKPTDKIDIQLLPLDVVIPTPDNPRIFREDNPADKELVLSIKALGVLEPVLCRPLPGGKYDLRAGERRWRAAKKAGLTEIPAIVREMTDEEAIAVTVTENLQREDLEPLEEANGIRTLLDRGWTLAQVGQELGKPVTWIARRAKLADLSVKWQKLIADLHLDVSFWSASHLELIARMPQHIQDGLVFDRYRQENYGDYAVISVNDLRDGLVDLLKVIELAPWKPGDEGLVPKAGSCDKCTTRSDRQPELFDESELEPRSTKSGPSTRCMDNECWENKLQAHLLAEEARLKSEHDNVIVVGYPEDTKDTPWAEKAVAPHRLSKAKQSTPGAIPTLIVGGLDAGTIAWSLPGYHQGHGTSGSSAAKGTPKPLKERREKYDRLRRRIVVHSIIEKLKARKGPPSDLDTAGLLVFVRAFGTDFRRNFTGDGYLPGGTAWKVLGKLSAADTKYKDETETETVDVHASALFMSSLQVLITRLTNGVGVDSVMDPEIEAVCKLFTFDVKALRKEAAEAKPYPKSWASLNEDGTPKKKAVAKKKAKAKKKPVTKKKKAAKKKPVTKKKAKAKKSEAKRINEAAKGLNEARAEARQAQRALDEDEESQEKA